MQNGFFVNWKSTAEKKSIYKFFSRSANVSVVANDECEAKTRTANGNLFLPGSIFFFLSRAEMKTHLFADGTRF